MNYMYKIEVLISEMKPQRLRVAFMLHDFEKVDIEHAAVKERWYEQ